MTSLGSASTWLKTFKTEVQVLRVGDYFIVGLPSEVFVEYQIETCDRPGANFTFVSELANRLHFVRAHAKGL